MEWLVDLITQFWWLLLVFGGSIAGGVRAVAAWNERRANRRLERFRIKHETKVALAQAQGLGRIDAQQAQAELGKLQAEHDQIDARWFAYETDLATILDYPMMVDLREQLTVDFHKAKRLADVLRPVGVDPTGLTATGIAEYRDAVRAYGAAFEVAEHEAKRRRRGDFTALEQERLAKAQRLLAVALNGGATGAERQQAYRRARKELDGLVNLPKPATVALERQVRAALEGP